MADDDLDDLRYRDLRAFDRALHKLYDDGLLSERTMSGMWADAHRESEEMLSLKRLERGL